MPAHHDLDPDAMTEEERLAKRRYQSGFVFETMPAAGCDRGHPQQNHTLTFDGPRCTLCDCTRPPETA
jgi:hypothetical protein